MNAKIGFGNRPDNYDEMEVRKAAGEGAEKDLVLVVKTSRATLIAQRITRIATNEAHFEVAQGASRQEIMVPFADIQEIQIKHKDA